jgi:phosphomannomutase
MEVDGIFVFVDVDNPFKKGLLSKLKEEIKGFELLPACSVDCDEDRFLATSPFLSIQDIPYLSGDLMIMLLAYNLKENIKKVVFTVESGLSIGRFLENMGIGYEEVTVGDRAIADYIMDPERLDKVEPGERHKIIGGEPSGHMMFGNLEDGKMVLVDDPVITQLKIIALMRKTGKNFDTLLKEVLNSVEEVYTARKPDAWAGKPNSQGISLSEKIKLELRIPGNEKVILTEYARQSGIY